MPIYAASDWLQFRNTKLDRFALDNLDLVGRITSPARLKTLSLAAELTGGVKIALANGKRLLNCGSKKTSRLCPQTTDVEENSVYWGLMSSTDGAVFNVCDCAPEADMKLK